MKSVKYFIATTAASISLLGPLEAQAQPYASEASENLRVCDAFGRGYFYLPGTETCLSFGLQIRSELGFGGNVSSGADPDGHFSVLRPTFRVSTASETELGILRTTSEHRWNFSMGRQLGYRLYRNYIELGGFKAGLDESAFKTFDSDYADVINDGIVSAGGYRTTLISYTFRPDPRLQLVLSAEQGGNDDSNVDVAIKSGMPYLVGGIKFSDNNLTTSMRLAYDTLNDSVAAKFRMSYKVDETLTVWGMVGYKTNDDHYALNAASQPYRVIDSFYGTWGGDFAGWAGVAYKATPKTSFNLQIAYDGTETFAATANFAHTLVPGLLIMPEVSYTSWNDKRSWRDGIDQAQARVRLQYRF